jgi:hypothetical protein
MQLVDKEVAFARLDICAECPRLFTPTFTCKECGCFMKVKTRLAGSSCPLGKWTAEGQDNG